MLKRKFFKFLKIFFQIKHLILFLSVVNDTFTAEQLLKQFRNHFQDFENLKFQLENMCSRVIKIFCLKSIF